MVPTFPLGATVRPGTDSSGAHVWGAAAQAGDQAPALLQSIAAGVPLGRLASPDEIAAVVVFLASEQNSFVTGTELFIDGGTNQI